MYHETLTTEPWLGTYVHKWALNLNLNRIFWYYSDAMELKQGLNRIFYLTEVPHTLPRVFLFLSSHIDLVLSESVWRWDFYKNKKILSFL